MLTAGAVPVRRAAPLPSEVEKAEASHRVVTIEDGVEVVESADIVGEWRFTDVTTGQVVKILRGPRQAEPESDEPLKPRLVFGDKSLVWQRSRPNGKRTQQQVQEAEPRQLSLFDAPVSAPPPSEEAHAEAEVEEPVQLTLFG